MSDNIVMTRLDAARLNHAFAQHGWTSADVRRLCVGDSLAQLLPFVRGLPWIELIQHVIDLDADPRMPREWCSDERWTIQEHHKSGHFRWDPRKIRLQRMPRLSGKALRDYFTALPAFNARLLDYLLEHPHLIPKKWKGKVISFGGTIYCNERGTQLIRGLDYKGVDAHLTTCDLFLDSCWYNIHFFTAFRED